MSEIPARRCCDACGKDMGPENRPDIKPEDGAFRMFFSAYYAGDKWDRNEPPDGDACSRACGVKILRLALAHIDPEWRRDMRAGEVRVADNKKKAAW